jgi:hypothetical protein
MSAKVEKLELISDPNINEIKVEVKPDTSDMVIFGLMSGGGYKYGTSYTTSIS